MLPGCDQTRLLTIWLEASGEGFWVKYFTPIAQPCQATGPIRSAETNEATTGYSILSAVKSLGKSQYRYAHGGDSMTAKGPEVSQLAKLEKMRELAKMLESYGFLRGNFGGGGQTRTVDSADMSRVRSP